ncbi:glycosyltransferase family 2 protein [Pseudomonas panipatensis]|uniref:glycosyltransferase family 2 protein n=1 Tax=Pseudomonas panipatensis TaxID=428992 RepID=UPI0035B17225
MTHHSSAQHQGRHSDQVAILLSTYNGAAFLAEQLDSLIAQTHPHWTIYASDDGSSDATLEILADYQKRLGADRLIIVDGPRRGFAANFLSLLAREEVQGAYFAFCDQDDFWKPERLATGIDWIRTIPQERPALFCSRTELIDAQGNTIGFSPLFRKPACFENALVQSIAGGNTMLFNRAARDLLRQTRDASHVVSHDWWAYILVTGCGGEVNCAPTPTIGYRQHGNNIVGSNSSLGDRLVRVRKMFQGTFHAWTDDNLRALSAFRDRLSPENQATLKLFEQGRKAGLLARLILIRQSGVHRQTLPGTLGLAAAAILQRI